MIGIAAAGGVAAADWAAVARGTRRAEAVLKPLVAAILAAVALAAQGWWFSAALLLCLAGDVLLLPQVDRFRSGLAAFLLAHLAFIAGLLTYPLDASKLVYTPPILALVIVLAPRIVRSAPRSVRLPIVAYMLVLVALFAAAWLAHRPAAVAGAGLFVISDTLLAWNRFVQPLPAGRLAVMVTYHLAICLLTVSLLF